MRHALGQRSDRFIKRGDVQVERVKERDHPRCVKRGAVKLRHIGQEIPPRQIIGRNETFREKCHPRAGAGRGVRDAENFDCAAIDRQQIQHTFQQRGFSRAIDTGEGDALPFGNAQGNTGQRDSRAIALRYIRKMNRNVSHLD